MDWKYEFLINHSASLETWLPLCRFENVVYCFIMAVQILLKIFNLKNWKEKSKVISYHNSFEHLFILISERKDMVVKQ